MKLNSFFIKWLFAFIFLNLIAGSAIGHQEDFEMMGVVKPRNELPAPGFTLESLTGGPVSLDDFKGKAILLNFWATWCAPCKDELPSMQRLYDALKVNGVEVLAISIDRNNKEKVNEYKTKYNLTFPVLLDPNQKVRKDYFIMGLPTSYLIGTDGKLKGFISGARQWDSITAKNIFSAMSN